MGKGGEQTGHQMKPLAVLWKVLHFSDHSEQRVFVFLALVPPTTKEPLRLKRGGSESAHQFVE